MLWLSRYIIVSAFLDATGMNGLMLKNSAATSGLSNKMSAGLKMVRL